MTQITMTQRFGRAALVGAAGGAVALAIMMADSMFRSDYSFLRAATMGAFLAGLLVARGFGGAGTRGWFWAGASFAAATILGALFAVPLLFLDEMLMPMGVLATLGESATTALWGPVYVLGALGELLVLKVWATLCILIHMVVIGGSLRAQSNP